MSRTSVGLIPTAAAERVGEEIVGGRAADVGQEVWNTLPTVFNTQRPFWDTTGAVIGGLAFRKHPLLGILGGAAVGRNVPTLIEGTAAERTEAGLNLGTIAATIFGASLSKKRKHRVLGGIAGYLIGAGVSAAVPGTSARDHLSRAIDKIRGK